jgi:adenine-specific DNA-methyltransferase
MSFNSRLTDLLKKDPRFVDDEGELLIAAVQDRAWKIDRDLVKLLLADKEIKAKFFDEIVGHWVFNLNTFIEYVSHKNFLDNSYTRFRNRIGLTIGDKYLRERGDVALAWPYKDCLLEGGQTKEEEKRREIFFNEILAEDEINRLLAPKALTNFVRHTAKGKHPVKEFKRDKNGILRDNLVIKGNNLLALHALKTLFRGQIRLIYLDPPYNSGSDSFGYNDNFNRAAWLTFMKSRLEISRELLSNDGAIVVQISDRQVGYLHVLMEDVFPDGFINKIAIKTRSPSGFKTVNQGVFESAEYLLIYGKERRSWTYNPQFEVTDYDENYCFQVSNYHEPVSKWKIRNIKDIVASRHGFKNPREAKKSLGKAVFLAELAQYAIENAESVFRYTEINTDAGKETLELKTLSLKKPTKVLVQERKGFDSRFIMNGQELAFYANKVREIDGEKVPTTMLTNIWTDIAWEGIAAEGGVKLKKGKKPERLLRRLIAMGTSKGTDIRLYGL